MSISKKTMVLRVGQVYRGVYAMEPASLKITEIAVDSIGNHTIWFRAALVSWLPRLFWGPFGLEDNDSPQEFIKRLVRAETQMYAKNVQELKVNYEY